MRKTLLLILISAFTTSFLCNAQQDTLNLGNFENGSLSPWYSWGAPISVEPNPSMTGNASDSVALLDQVGKTWNGFAMWHPGILDVNDDSLLVDVYLNTAGTFQLWLGNPASSGAATYTKAVSVPAKTWTHISFDLSGLPGYDYQQVAFQSDISDSVFIDNIMLVRHVGNYVSGMITRETFGTTVYDANDTPAKTYGYSGHYNYTEVTDFSSTNGHIIAGSDSSVRINTYAGGWPAPAGLPNPSGPANLLLVNNPGSYNGSWDTVIYSGINIANAIVDTVSFAYGKNPTHWDGNPNTQSINVEYRMDGGNWVQMDTSLIDTISAGRWEYVKLPVSGNGTTMDVRLEGLNTDQVFVDDLSLFGKIAPALGSKDFPISNVIVGSVTDSADFTGKLHMSWDADSIYMVYNITDDTVISSGGPNYDVDNLEIYFDMTNSKRIHWPRNGGWMANDTTYDTLDYQLRLVPDSSFSVNNAPRPGGISLPDTVVKQMYMKTAGGYQFKLDIAWNGLMPGFNAAPGTQIGFDVLASDADNVNAVTDANRNQITFNSPTDKPFNDPSLFATIELESGGGFKVIPDDQPPTAPSNIKATVDTNSVTLTWNASTDNTAVMYYTISQNGDSVTTILAKKSGNTYTEKGMANGTYNFVVKAIDNYGNLSNGGGASATVNYTVGIKEHTINNIVLYPNPVRNQLNISNASSVVSAEILGINGAVIMTVANHSENNFTVNTQSLNAGVYFVKLRTADGSIIMNKFIKQ